MRINMTATKIILYFAMVMATVMLSSQAPQAVLVDQDVAAQEEYSDGAGRGGDEWWRNYEVVEDRANELGDHLEMLYMYSVNPLELTTVRSTHRRSTTTPPPLVPVSPVSRPQPVVQRRTTTLAPPPPPPTEPQFSGHVPDLRVQSPSVAPQRRAPSESQQFPREQIPFEGHVPRQNFHQRPPSAVAPPTEPPFNGPASDFRVQSPQAVPQRNAPQQFPRNQIPFEGHAPRQSFNQRPQTPLGALQSQSTLSAFHNQAASESQLLPRRHPSTPVTSPEPEPQLVQPTGPWVQEQTFPEQLPAVQSQQPVDVHSFQQEETSVPSIPLNPPAEAPVDLQPQKPVFFVPSLPNIAQTQAPPAPESNNDFSTFSSDREFTNVPSTIQQDEVQAQLAIHPTPDASFVPHPSTAAFSPETSATSGTTTKNPFLAPAAIPVVQQRYSRLLNRYSLLDQVNEGLQAVPPANGPEVLENNRLVRQPTPVGHAPFAPSSRNFLNHSLEEPTIASKRPRRRRLKTTTPVPSTETDTQLSDSEEVLFSQPQPSRRLKSTSGRFLPSTTISAATIDTSLSQTTATPLKVDFQSEPLSIQSPAARPISGSRRRTKRPLQEAVAGDFSTANASPVASSQRDVVQSSRSTRPQPFQTAPVERVADPVASAATDNPEPNFSTSAPVSPFKSGRIQKTRPSFSPKATTFAPSTSTNSELQNLPQTPEVGTGRRSRFGATPSSRRFSPGAVSTPELSIDPSPLASSSDIQSSPLVPEVSTGRRARFGATQSSGRFSTGAASTPELPADASPLASSPDIQSSPLVPEVNTGRRTRFGATQRSSRFSPGAVATSELPVDASTLPFSPDIQSSALTPEVNTGRRARFGATQRSSRFSSGVVATTELPVEASTLASSQEFQSSALTPEVSTGRRARFGATRRFSPGAVSTSELPVEVSTLASSQELQSSALTPEVSTGRRARFGASPSSRRFSPGAVSTSESPVEASTFPLPVTLQNDGSSRRLKPRTSGQRFTTAPPFTTIPTSTTSTVSSSPAVDTGSASDLPQAAAFQSQSASKFKPRGSSFRRTTTTLPTTAAPTTTVPATTTADSTSVTELPKQPEAGTGSRFKPRPSKFRAFPTGTTTTATTVAATEATTNSVSSTELLETTTTTTTSGKPRKFQPKNSFPRFQDSAKRAPFTRATTTEATTTTSPTTTRTTSSRLFKSRAPFSRFQPGATKAPPAVVTEITPVDTSTVEIAQPILNPQPATSPRTSQRPLFKTRTSGQFPFRDAATTASTAAPPSLAPVVETSPADVPVNAVPPVATTLVEQDAQTPFNSKRRRRPITKKSFNPASFDVTASTLTSPEVPSFLGQRQEEPVPAYQAPIVQSPAPVANEQPIPLELQAVFPSSPEAVPVKRKVRRRKLTKKRSTQSFSDEKAAASEITQVTANLTSAVTSAVTENVTTITTAAATTAAFTTSAVTTSASTLTPTTTATTTTTTVATTTTAPHTTTTVGAALKDSFIAKDKSLESKSGLLGKSAKKQLLLEIAEEPLTAEADESGDDSGIWFSDSAGIGAEAGSFAQGARGVGGDGSLHKLFTVEHEDAVIRNPPSAQIRRNSDEDDSKSWFGLADDGLTKGADSSPEKTVVVHNDTEHHQSRALSESKPEPEEQIVREEQPAVQDGQEAVVDSSGDADKENKTATFSVSSSTSVHTEVSKSRSTQAAQEAAEAREEELKFEEGPPPIIIIDKVSLSSDDRQEENTPSPDEELGNGRFESTEAESTTTTTTTTTATTTTEEVTTTGRATPKTERSSRGRTTTSTTARSRSRDKNSRTPSRDAASRNRASAARSESSGKTAERGRSGTSSRRDRTSTTTPASPTTEELPVTEGSEVPEVSEAPKKKPSDEVNYFGEDEVVPSSHGALDGPADGGLESGPPEADFQAEAESVDGEVASVDVSEHNDPNDRGHGSETAGDDDASRWELSPLSDFNGPIRESSSFNVEVLSKAPKQLQLASRRETKSSRSDLGDEFSSKRETRDKMRNFLKIIGLNAAAFGTDAVTSGSDNDTESATKRVRVIPLKSFAFPLPPMKTPEDIAELFETITSAPSGASRPFQPPPRAAILRINSTTSNDTVSEGVIAATSLTPSLPAASFKTQALNGPTNCSRSDRNICPTSEEYPRNLVDLVVKQHEGTVKRLWQELEAKRTPAELFPEDSERKGEALSVCDSSIEALQPGWARDATTGKWMIIINTPDYPQFLRVESCLRLKKECLFISPYYKSSCVEHYSAHRMVAIRPNDPASGPVVAIFKFPCGCSCKVGMLHGSN